MPSLAIPVPEDCLKLSSSSSRFPTLLQRNHELCLGISREFVKQFNLGMGTPLDIKTVSNIPQLGPVHIIALFIPECLPERLPLVTRFADFGFLEKVYNGPFADKLASADTSDGDRNNFKQFKSSLFAELMDTDRELAPDIITTFTDRCEFNYSTPELQTWEDYLSFQVAHHRFSLLQTLVCFALGIHLTKEAKAKYSEIVNAAMFARALDNDRHAWPMEIRYHLATDGSKEPLNGVAFLMRRCKLSEQEALSKLRQESLAYQEKYLALLKQLDVEGLLEPDRNYILSAQYAVSGFDLWAAFNPHFPSKSDLDQPDCVLVDGILKFKHVEWDPISIPKSTLFPQKGGIDGQYARRMLEIVMPSEELVMAPFEYISSLPSKKLRDSLIDGINLWLNVPNSTAREIKKLVDTLHNAALLADDIEDNSLLRRGKPATHILYGIGQTINSSGFVFIKALASARKLNSPDALEICLEEQQRVFIGQSYDIYWTYHCHCPTVEEYVKMIDAKTGSGFFLSVRLMRAEANLPCTSADYKFPILLTRYFQIRDDYQNLTSQEFTDKKGFCEDLDEGKMSFPLIHTLNQPGPHQAVIKGLFMHRPADGISIESKRLILAYMQENGSLDYTLNLILQLQDDVMEELQHLENQYGSENPILRSLLSKLKM